MSETIEKIRYSYDDIHRIVKKMAQDIAGSFIPGT